MDGHLDRPGSNQSLEAADSQVRLYGLVDRIASEPSTLFGDGRTILEMETSPDPGPLSRQIQHGHGTSSRSQILATWHDGSVSFVILLTTMGTCALAS